MKQSNCSSESIYLHEILSAGEASRIAAAQLGLHIEHKSEKNSGENLMFMLHVRCSSLPSPYRSLPSLARRMDSAERQKRKKSLSTNLTDELKEKMLISRIFPPSAIQSLRNKRFFPAECFIIIYLKCQYGSEQNSFCALLRCKSSTQNKSEAKLCERWDTI